MAGYKEVLSQIRKEYPNYAELPDEIVLAGLYKTYYSDKMSLDEFHNSIGYVEPDLDAPFDMSFTETMENVPDSGKQYGKDFYSAVTHPIDTLSTVRGLAQGVLEKALPGEVSTDYTQLADSVGDMYADRLGSWNRIKRTIQEDPVGALAELSLVGGGVGMIPKLGKLGKFSQKLDPVNLALSLSAKTLSKMYPKGLPVKLMNQVMMWDTVQKGSSSSTKSRIMLENKLPPNFSGVEKGWNKVFILNDKIDEILKNAGDQKIPRSRIFRHIKELKEDLVKGATPYEDLADVQKVVDRLEEIWYNYDMKDFTPAELQHLKKDFYQATKKAYEKTQAPSTGTEQARVAMAKAAREDIEAIDPSIKPINVMEGELLDVLPQMQKKVNRISNRSVIPLNMPGTTGIGYLVGEALGMPKTGAGVGFTASVMDMPRAKAAIAQGLHNLQNFGMAGDSLTPLMIRNQMLLQERNERNQQMKGILSVPFASGSY